MRGVGLLVTGLLLSCSAEPARPSSTPRAAATAKPAEKAETRPGKGTLLRADVDALVDRGFASFLQQVDVEPRLVDGRFRGWSVVELRPSQFWMGVDIEPGDIVTRVNGLPIERETEAYDAFESLKASDSLRVAIERGGENRVLTYAIVER